MGKRRVALGTALLTLFCVAVLATPAAGGMTRIPRPQQALHGIRAKLVPTKLGLQVMVELVNTGSAEAYVHRGPGSSWTLHVFAITNGSLQKVPRTAAGRAMAMRSDMGPFPPRVYIRPGQSDIQRLGLRNYFVLKAPGKFIIQATRWIGFKGRKHWILMGTNLLELNLDRAGKITWKTRNVTWPKPVPRKIPPGPVLQSSQIPKTGPVAALAQLAGAIKRRDAQAARRLVYAPSGETYNLAVVNEELAFNRLADALGQRFGADAKARLVPIPPAISPTATQYTLRHLDLKTLRIEGNTATIRMWSFTYGGLWKWMPSIPVYFRRVQGMWKLSDGPDSNRFPRNSPPRIWDRFVRARAVIYDSLRHNLDAGKFHSWLDFDAQYKARFAAAAKENSAEIMAYMQGLMRKYHAKMEAEKKANLEAFKKAQERDHQVPEEKTTQTAPAAQ